MVLEMSAVQRPRRLAAVKAQQKGGARNDRDQPKTGSLARRKSVPAKKNAGRVAALVEPSIASSDAGSEHSEDEHDSAAFESAQEESEVESVTDDDDNYIQAKSSKSSGKKRKTTKQNIKSTSKTSKAAKVHPPKKSRVNVGPSRNRRGGGREELPINKDNKLFNAVQDGENAHTIAEDWISYYQDNQPAALAQFVNFVFRCCGCNGTIDEVQVEDVDNAIETLEDVQEQFKEQNINSYPLTSRAQVYRRFRRSLSELVEQIFSMASEADLLEDQTMVDRLLVWIATLSSSPYRAIRHTSTTFALMMTGQVARLNQEARKQFEQASKLRDAEKSAKASAARIRKLNEDVHRVNARRQTLDAYHKELDETIFIHRYRDSDPMIRADCMEELGRWMRLCPGQFLSNAYFKYLAWELSDESAAVRLMVIQALQYIFSRPQTSSAVTLFVERVMARMVEIAVGDVDVGVRVAMIQALLHLDQTMPFEDEDDRDQIARQLFDEDAKVRVAAARFVANVIDDKIQEAGKNDKESGKSRFKFLAECMHRWTMQIDEPAEQANVEEDREEAPSRTKTNADGTSRLTLAYAALWTASEELREITPLLELLQVDHSGAAKSAASKRVSSKKTGQDTALTAEEETILIELLVAMLQKAHGDAQQSSKTLDKASDEEAADVALTKELIPVLSTLFTKYKTETNRISTILLLPKSMRISAYLEQEQTSEFESLWDHLIDQFERHPQEVVIERAASAMSSLNATVALSAVNDVKLSSICEGTAIAIKDSVTSFSLLANVRAFEEGDRERLTANVARMQALCRHFDLTLLLEETDSEQDGSVWDILLASAQRATSLRPEESALIKHALATCSLYIMWKVRGVLQQEDGKEAMAEALSIKVQAFLSLCERIVEKGIAGEQEQAIVQIEAFKQQIDIHILLANVAAMDEQQKSSEAAYVAKLPETLHVACSATTQAALASFVEAALEMFRGRVEEATEKGLEESFSFLRGQDAFVSIVAHYIGAIRIGMVDIRHSATLLAYYGRMGPLYDACLRVLVEAVRETGIGAGHAKIALRVILDALTKAHSLQAQDRSSEVTFINFAKLLSSCLVVRGSHLTFLRSMDGDAVREFHERAIEWTLEQVKQAQGGGTEADHGLDALVLLKGLAQLTISLSPRDALQVKSALQRTIASKAIKVPETPDRPWDGLHNYEKRLVTIASKSDALSRQGGRTTASAARQQAAQRTDDDANAQAAVDGGSNQRPRPRPRETAVSTFDEDASEAPLGLTQQDETAVDSILGFAADDSLADLHRVGEDSLAFFDQAGFDLSQDASEREASQAVLFRGMADESQTQESIVRPSRRARPSQSMREDDDDDNEDSAMNNARRKRSRRA